MTIGCIIWILIVNLSVCTTGSIVKLEGMIVFTYACGKRRNATQLGPRKAWLLYLLGTINIAFMETTIKKTEWINKTFKAILSRDYYHEALLLIILLSHLYPFSSIFVRPFTHPFPGQSANSWDRLLSDRFSTQLHGFLLISTFGYLCERWTDPRVQDVSKETMCVSTNVDKILSVY